MSRRRIGQEGLVRHPVRIDLGGPGNITDVGALAAWTMPITIPLLSSQRAKIEYASAMSRHISIAVVKSSVRLFDG